MRLERSVEFQDWGRISYQEAWDRQTKLQQNLISYKRKVRNRPQGAPHHYFVLCEHPHVFTLGKSGSMDHLLMTKTEMEQAHIEFFKINRGGDITYHGPGQIVGYPILDLEFFFTDVHRLVRTIEQAIINVLADYGLEGERRKGYTGVWLPSTSTLPDRKICAIGIHLSRWVSLHGFAFNISPDLSYFKRIIPCGISDANKAVTSLSLELDTEIETEEVKGKVLDQFEGIFDWDWHKNPKPKKN
ncbi:MAG: lipoyl(octanoyl) transferase LipB [Bacteroidetes bacterium]|jgi:lipoyl(octanoyl) transferase|nr:lipoyl(octanoyl) transferase LipB [Bacteroidota bacterium]